MVLAAVLKKPDVTDVTVVEIDQDVIDLVGSTYAGDRRLAIVNADAFTYQPPEGQRYGMVWHDIWDGIRTANSNRWAPPRRSTTSRPSRHGCAGRLQPPRGAVRRVGKRRGCSMGRSHHDQVRPVLREARLAIQQLLRRPGWPSAQVVRSFPVTDKRSATLLTQIDRVARARLRRGQRDTQ